MKKVTRTASVGMAMLAGSAGFYLSREHGALVPADIDSKQYGARSVETFENSGLLEYELENGFGSGIEGPKSQVDVPRSGFLFSTEGLFTNRLILNSIYEYRDGSWRLTPYIGARLGRVDVSEGLLHNSAHDSITAYELRGGVVFGMTQKLFGNLEYRWTDGSKPYLSLAGIPGKIEVDRHGFLVGVNYHF